MRAFTLTQEPDQLLRDQVIDADRPGPILRDFQMLLDFVGSAGLKAAGKYNLLPMDALGELDRRLSRPLELEMKRPQLRSHPYLQGLHLLLRASGLVGVEGIGAKARLVVVAAAHDSWRHLNPTEQYFTLLEAWFRVGRPEMVGEPVRRFDGFLYQCSQAWGSVREKGQKFDLQSPDDIHLWGIRRRFYLLALMDLFGLMLVERPRARVQPWCPAAVRHVPFGDAVFTLLAQHTNPLHFDFPLESVEEQEEPTHEIRFGAWQPFFQPYFPAWRDNLVLPKPERKKGTFVFRVSLGPIWRRIAMPDRATLDDLLGWILKAFEFDSDHLYEFSYCGRFGSAITASDPRCEEGPWAHRIRLGELPLLPGQFMRLTYDFGDNWDFTVTLESVEPPESKLKAPRIVESHGEAPEQYPVRE